MIWTQRNTNRFKELYNDNIPMAEISNILEITISQAKNHAKRLGLLPRYFEIGKNKSIGRASVKDVKTAAMGVQLLTRDVCRYPIGDPRSDDFRFCMNPIKENSVYCEECHAKCHEPPRPRRRKR